MKNKYGVTLIEMVLVILVLGITVPPLLNVFSHISVNAVRSEAITQATYLAQELMEEIKSKKFDENSISPWSNPLGPETGESRLIWDDVDDFDGYTESSISGFEGYSRSVTVVYVDPDTYDLDTSRPDTENNLNYKKVVISVSRSDGLVSDLELVTIITTLEFL